MIKTDLKRKTLTFLIVFIVILTQPAEIFVNAAIIKQQTDPKYTWNLHDIYKSQESFDMDYSKIINELIPEIKKFSGKISNPSITRANIDEKVKYSKEITYKYDNLLKTLKLCDTLERTDFNLYLYAHLMLDLNIEDQTASDLCAKTEQLNAQVLSATAYIEPEILQIPEKTLKTIMNDKRYSDYKHYIDSLIKQKYHKLSKADEEVLAKVSDALGKPEVIYNNLMRGDYSDAVITDKNGIVIKLTEAVYAEIAKDPDREYRKKAFKIYMNNFGKLKNTCAAVLNASIKEDFVIAKLRKYKSSLDASLNEDFIPDSVFNNIISSVNKNLPYLHRYYELRKDIIKVDKIHAYDLNIPIVNESIDNKMIFPFEKGKETILQGLKPLGKEYISNVKNGFDNRWIDVYPKDKKASGGYNWGTYDTHPFILLNYDDSLDGVLTVAHEMGHAMNSVYTNKTQPAVNSGNSLFTAEVASTANELLIMNYLINNAKTDEEKLYLINQQIENIKGTVYTQILYSEFEKYMHDKVSKGESLTANILNSKWLELTRKYNGNAFEVDEESGYNWMRISHFYRPFYVYKYAASMSAAYELVKQMNKEGKPATARYIAFLKSGTSDYPIELLKKAGVDMTSTKPVDSLLEYFNSLVGQMEQILKKEGKIR